MEDTPEYINKLMHGKPFNVIWSEAKQAWMLSRHILNDTTPLLDNIGAYLRGYDDAMREFLR